MRQHLPQDRSLTRQPVQQRGRVHSSRLRRQASRNLSQIRPRTPVPTRPATRPQGTQKPRPPTRPRPRQNRAPTALLKPQLAHGPARHRAVCQTAWPNLRPMEWQRRPRLQQSKRPPPLQHRPKKQPQPQPQELRAKWVRRKPPLPPTVQSR